MGTNVIQWSNFDDQVRYQPISGILPVPWTPADTTTALWLDANDASTITEVTGVSDWADKGSVGTRDAVQATGSKQPNYNTTTKAVECDGVDDNIVSTFGATLTQPNTIFVVGNYDVNAEFRLMYDGIDASNRHMIYEDSPSWYINSGVDFNTGVSADTSQRIYMATYNGASSAFRLDGGTEATGNAGTQSLTGLTLGGAYNNALYANANFNEVILIEGTISTDLRETIEGYAAWKWDGINGNTNRVDALPALHTYKTAAPLV